MIPVNELWLMCRLDRPKGSLFLFNSIRILDLNHLMKNSMCVWIFILVILVSDCRSVIDATIAIKCPPNGGQT